MRRFSSLGCLFLLLGSLTACSTTRGRADDAFARGDYATAAELYADVVARHPDDAGAKDLLASSRARAVDARLAEADAAIGAHDDNRALEATRKIVDACAAWSYAPVGAARERVARLVTWASGTIRAEVLHARDSAGVFAAEAALSARMPLLRHREFGSTSGELAAIVADAGAANCAALTARASAQSPYLTELIAAYCRHFHAPVPAVPPLPDLVSHLEVDARVAGLSDAQRAQLASSVDAWLRDSIWYAPEPAPAGRVALSGEVRSAFDAATVTRQVDWIERVPYVTTETYQEPYRESYLDTERYSEQVPYTDTETYQSTCGSGTNTYSCSQTRSVTRYRTEYKSRLVTKWRTAYRTATRMVTRYRDEARTFTYDVVARTGRYSSDWSAQFFFGAAPVLEIHRANDARRQGDDHDADFPPAGVHPSRANLMPHEAWVATQVGDLGHAFAAAASQHWGRVFCARATFSEEEAARCVYARQRAYSPAVIAPLRPIFGSELDPLIAVAE